jgi:heme A synthase
VTSLLPPTPSFNHRAPAGIARLDPIGRLGWFAWGVLTYEIAVVAWGAYVRATGSGAGCGRHWPLCNGVVIPRAARVETLVELSHRVTSGGALVLSVVLLVWSLRAFPPGHRVQRGAIAATAFMFAEALIGAGLVLFELVAHDASMKRALSVSLHLVNTFFLLGSTALTAWWASGGAPVRLRGGSPQGPPTPVLWAVGVPLAALLLVGATGAVTALGDTLFPSASLSAGLADDFSAKAHLFVRLRAIHPLLASITAVSTLAALGFVRALRPSAGVRRLANAATALIVAQVALGLFDVMTLAPVWAQLAHLVLADAVWVSLVLVGAAALADPSAAPAAEAPVPPTAPIASAP